MTFARGSIYKNSGLEVQRLKEVAFQEDKAMKVLQHEAAAFMAFLFGHKGDSCPPCETPLKRHLDFKSISHEGHPYLPGREKIKLFGGFMAKTICKRAATVQFWDGYARWYKLWMEHNSYHDRIIEVLTTMARPGWKVLDIRAGNGVLSLPLCAIGCDVTVLEPSIGIRNLLFEEAFKRGIDWINVDGRRWEDIPCYQLKHYDLVMACNSLHLTQMGFQNALKKVFKIGAHHVFVITELGPPEIKVRWQYDNYTMSFAKCYETESSFAYHFMNEFIEHWTFKKGRILYPDEVLEIKAQLISGDEHLWIKDNAYVGMYWWDRERTTKGRD